MREFRNYIGQLVLHLDCPHCTRFVEITFEDKVVEEKKQEVSDKLDRALFHHLKRYHRGVYVN